MDSHARVHARSACVDARGFLCLWAASWASLVLMPLGCELGFPTGRLRWPCGWASLALRTRGPRSGGASPLE
eukprot:13573291-Alexandrium_andersonii.AAC.1